MIAKDNMFSMVINSQSLIDSYQYNPNDYPDCASGLDSDNAVVATIAMMIDEISSTLAKNKILDEKGLYQKLFNYLNSNLMFI